MATFTEPLDFAVGLDATGFKKGIDDLSGEAKKASKGIAKGFDATGTAVDGVGKSAKKAAGDVGGLADSTKKAAKGLETAEDASGEASQSLTGLADILEVVGLESAAAGTRLAGDLGGGIEGVIKGSSGLAGVLSVDLVAGLGLATVAVGVLAGAWRIASNELDTANANTARAREELNAMVPLINAVKEAKLQEALATGELSQEDFDRAIVAKQAADIFEGRINDQLSKLNDLRIAEGEASKATVEQIAAHNSIHGIATKTAVERTEQTRDFEAEIKSAQLELGNLTDLQTAYTDSVGNTKALERFTAAQGEATAALREQEGAIQQLTAIGQAAVGSTLEGEEAIIFKRDQVLDQIEALEDGEASRAAAAETASAAVIAASDAEITALRENAAEKAAIEAEALQATSDATLAKLDTIIVGLEKEVEAERESADAQRKSDAEDLAKSLALAADAAAQVFGFAVDSQVDIASSAKDEFEAMSDAERAAQREGFIEEQKLRKEGIQDAFQAQQAASITSALILGGVAIARQYADLPLIAAIPASIAVAAITGVQVAAIAGQSAPEFHLGGIVGSDPSERVITARAGEGVLTAQGVNAIGGAGGLAAANSGRRRSETVFQELRVGARTTERMLLESRGGFGAGRRLTRSERPSGRTNPFAARV